jgi:hypothetical protein
MKNQLRPRAVTKTLEFSSTDENSKILVLSNQNDDLQSGQREMHVSVLNQRLMIRIELTSSDISSALSSCT